MTENSNGNGPDGEPDLEPDLEKERQEIADGQDVLDAQADGDGLAAEAGSGEESGLAEG